MKFNRILDSRGHLDQIHEFILIFFPKEGVIILLYRLFNTRVIGIYRVS